jgi:hypothetical protein
MIYQEVPMPSDSSYKIGVTDNGDAYTDVKLDGSGHLRVNVKPACVTIDYIRAYLPKDTITGLHKNQEVAFSYTVGDCASSTVDEKSEGIFIFPNPTSEIINIELEDGIIANQKMIQFIDLQGRKYFMPFSNTSKGYQVNVGHLPKGMYLLKFNTTSQSIYKKIIIQ